MPEEEVAESGFAAGSDKKVELGGSGEETLVKDGLRYVINANTALPDGGDQGADCGCDFVARGVCQADIERWASIVCGKDRGSRGSS